MIQNVFELADRNTRAIGARVSRLWSHRALDTLWRDLESIAPVLELVLHLEPTFIYVTNWKGVPVCGIESVSRPLNLAAQQLIDSQWASDPPETADWSRFASYTRRVRTIKCSDQARIKRKTLRIAASVFEDIVDYRPSNEPLFPNLRDLHWTTHYSETASAALLFVSPATEVMTIVVKESVFPSSYLKLITSLTGRLPNAWSLTIDTAIPASRVQAELADCLQTIPSLAHLKIPQFYLYPDVLRAASQMRSLATLSVTWDQKPVYEEGGMQLSCEKGWFENLGELIVDAHVQNFTAFLLASVYPHMTRVGLGTQKLTENSQLEGFCLALATSCPVLEELLLNLFSGRGPQSPREPIVFANLRPLLSCTTLTSLQIAHDYPMTLEGSDVAEMGDAWRALTCMRLCCEPLSASIRAGARGCPLSILPTCLKTFPHILEVGLFFSMDALGRSEDGVAVWMLRRGVLA